MSEQVAQAFAQCRHFYLRLTTQAPNRLTVSTFLAGLNFGAFAALLAVSNIPADRWPSHEDWLLILGGALLGFATVLFLITAINTYAVLQAVAAVAPSTARLLQHTQPTAIDVYDQERIADAYNLYNEANNMVPVGLGLVLAALPFIGAHLNLYVGGAVLLFLAFTLLFFFPLLLSAKSRSIWLALLQAPVRYARARRLK